MSMSNHATKIAWYEKLRSFTLHMLVRRKWAFVPGNYSLLCPRNDVDLAGSTTRLFRYSQKSQPLRL